MRLPDLSCLSIDAFSDVSLSDEGVPYIDGLYSDEKVFRFLKYLINRFRREGAVLSNAAGVAFDEDLLLRMVTKQPITFPLVVSGLSDPVFVETWEQGLFRTGMNVFTNYLYQPGSTIKSAIRRGIVPGRLKLLLELLDGTITLPHSAQPMLILKEKLRCAAGMRSPGYIENVENLSQGYAGNITDGSEDIHRLISSVHPSMEFYNGRAVRNLYASGEAECCRGDEGKDGVFQVGAPPTSISYDMLGSIDTLAPAGPQEYVTLITFIEPPSGGVPNAGDTIYNTDRIYTSTNPNWSYFPEVCYVLRMNTSFRCTVQERFENYSDIAVLSSKRVGNTLLVKTATLPVVVIPANMPFVVDRVEVVRAHSNSRTGNPTPVVFATWDDSYVPPKRQKAAPSPDSVVIDLQ